MGGCFGASAADAATPPALTDGTAIPICGGNDAAGDVGGANDEDGDGDVELRPTGPAECAGDGSPGE